MVNRFHLRKNKDKKGRIVEHLTSDEKKNIANLLIVCTVLIVISFCLAFFTSKDKSAGVLGFLGFTGPTATVKGVLVGLVSSTIFGMIDNGGLYFGMDALDPILPGDDLEKAGWGNTFSDFLGAFLGTFIGIFVKNVTGVEDTPLYSEVIGIIIGCVLGIYIPKAIKNTKVSVSVTTK